MKLARPLLLACVAMAPGCAHAPTPGGVPQLVGAWRSAIHIQSGPYAAAGPPMTASARATRIQT